MRRLSIAQLELSSAKRKRERLGMVASLGGCSSSTDSSHPVQNEADADTAARAAWSNLMDYRLNLRAKRYQLEELADDFPEEACRLRRIFSTRVDPLLRGLSLPRREPEEYDRLPSDPAEETRAGARSDEPFQTLTHEAKRNGRDVLLVGYRTSALEEERRLLRELAVLSSASLLHCPSLLRPLAFVASGPEASGQRLWLEYPNQGLHSIVRHVDAARAHAPGTVGARAEHAVGEIVRELTRQAMAALAYLHDRAGVVHKNLTPESLLVDIDGRLLVSRFELAGPAAVSSEDGGGDQAGPADASTFNPLASPPTPRVQSKRSRRTSVSQRASSIYASPELERGDFDALTSSSDIWQLGAVLHELTHRRDYKPSCVLHATGGSVDALLGAMLRTDPAQRPSAQALLSLDYFRESSIALLARDGHLPASDTWRSEGIKRVRAALDEAATRAGRDRFSSSFYGAERSFKCFMLKSSEIFSTKTLTQLDKLLGCPMQLRGKISV